MSTTSIDAPAGLRAAAGSENRRPRGANRRLVLPYLFLGVLVVYFLIPIWWLFVASTKTAAGLFNGSNGALWFDRTFALLPNLKVLFSYNDGIYLRWIANSLFYAVVGTILPGAGAIYLGQTLNFYKPVRIGDVALARVTVATIDEAAARVVLRCEIHVGDDLVMDGEATVRVPRRRRPPKAP